jgi:broad specificity polyphosphatase/5'/3'-nucleotidase SurE
MFLQPHKFDNINFPKSKQQLTYNMYIMASIYYRLTKQVLEGYLEKKRPAYYKVGNWLNVK